MQTKCTSPHLSIWGICTIVDKWERICKIRLRFVEVRYFLPWRICSTAIGSLSLMYALIYDMDSYLCVYVHILRLASNVYTAEHACTACAFCFSSSAEFFTLKEYSAIARLQNMGTLFLASCHFACSHPSAFWSANGCTLQYAHCLHSSSTNHRNFCLCKTCWQRYPTNGTFLIMKWFHTIDGHTAVLKQSVSFH